MAKRGFEELHPVVVKCGILITAFTQDKIRVKDVLFYIDLVKSLFRASNHFQEFELQTVQVLRFFEKCVSKGWAEAFKDGSARLFTLTPLGIHEILISLSRFEHVLPEPEVIYLQWFTDSYRPYLTSRLEPHISAKELEALQRFLATGAVFKQQIATIDAGISDLKTRIKESTQLQAYFAGCKLKGLSYAETLNAMPSDFSYRLSHQKRFKDWFAGLPPHFQTYEIEHGMESRQKGLYQRSLQHLETIKSFYQSMLVS